VTDALNWRWIFIISLFLIVISLLTGIYSIRQINPLQKVKIK
jgi:DHA2 family lincomycin resistance protein-like MFS transporter